MRMPFFLLVSIVFNLATISFLQAKEEGYLQVSDKHQIFYAAYGNPKGIPVVVLHGGPGLGCTDEFSRFFDLESWHVIMFDQRGAMRSKPLACMEENTTEHSIADIEALRKHFGIDRWVVWGGSWGSCLGLAYGQKHPEACLGFILRGIFLGRDEDIRFFKEMGTVSLKAYEEFLSCFSQEEQKDLLSATYQRICDPDPKIHMDMAKAVVRYQMSHRKSPPGEDQIEKALQDEEGILSFTRAFLHYAYHRCFLEPNQILLQMEKISHLPAIIIHGSSDTVCALEQAKLLHAQFKNSELWVIEGAGHSSEDPAIGNALVKAASSFVLKAKAIPMNSCCHEEEILQVGDPVLRKPSRKLSVEEILSPEIQNFIETMKASFKAAPAVGLAAPQIGKSVQMIVIEDMNHSHLTPEELMQRERYPVPFHVIINPSLYIEETETAEFFEACLSVPELIGVVPRAKSVRVECLNERGEPVTIHAKGWYARILQHEIDHLQGVLYLDRVLPSTLITQENYSKFWRGKDIKEVQACLTPK